MRKVVATVFNILFCLLWVAYGGVAGLAHSHPDPTADPEHGLGLDHTHDFHDHHHAAGLGCSAADPHHSGPVYMAVAALKPLAKSVSHPAERAGVIQPAAPARREARRIDPATPPRDPPSRDAHGLRAPPA